MNDIITVEKIHIPADGCIVERRQDNIFVPPGNLNIEREDMPQISSEVICDFLCWLEGKQIPVKNTVKLSRSLKPIQKEINIDKVRNIMNGDNVRSLLSMIITSIDDYIMDGHHRWLAILNSDNDSFINCWEIGLPMVDLLDLIHDFPKVKYKKINEKHFIKPANPVMR